MTNIKPTIRLDELIFPDCIIDLLFRKDEYCVQVSNIEGGIFRRKFIEYGFWKD